VSQAADPSELSGHFDRIAKHSDPGRSAGFLPVLLLAALAYSLAQTAVVPAISDMAKALGTDTNAVAWVLSAYFISSAIMTPIMGRLGDMFGKRRMLVLCLALYTVGCLIAAIGSDLSVVILGRVVQGCGAGIFPLCFGLVRDRGPVEKVAGRIGLISAITGIGGGLGLPLGGFLVDQASYRWIFWAGAGLGALCAISALLVVPESPVRAPGRVDVRGAIVLAVGLVAPLLAISQSDQWGWLDARTLGLIIGGLAVIALFLKMEARTQSPLIDVATLRLVPVVLTNVTTLMVGFSMFGIFVLLPELAQAPKSTGYGFGVSAAHAGLLLTPGALLMLAAGPAAGAIGVRWGNRIALSVGAFAAAAGLLAMTFAHATQSDIVLTNLLLFVGIGMAFAAMPNSVIDAVPMDKTGEATGVNALVRAVGSSLGSQVSASILAGSVVASDGYPTDHAYTVAFGLSATVAIIAGLTALTIPRPTRRRPPSLAEELGAATSLGEPAVAPYEQ
jgi:EmrB/QacA subfamily drug resistance transporter